MEQKLDYQRKAATCIERVRCTFVLTFAVMFMTLSVMYGSTEFFSNNSLTAINTLRNASFLKFNLTNVLMAPLSFQNELADTINVTVKRRAVSPVNGSKEFPGMPDPCAKPRRNTGVEDILCMKPPQFLPEYKNPCWLDNGVFRCLPYFHLIGICKSGTSDFFKRILLHPDLMPNKGIFGKEIWYWSWKRFSIKDRAGKFKLGMTLKEFSMKFDTNKIRDGVDKNGYHNKITGHGDPMDVWDRFREDSTPQNVPGAEELLWTTPYAVKHINPNVKLLLMLRDPIDRLYSHYFHGGYGTTSKSFHDDVVQSIEVWKACLAAHTIRHCIYSKDTKLRAPIHTSFYIVHLREWLKVFPREQLFIFRNEDFSVNMNATLRQIFTYLNVSIPEGTMKQMIPLPIFYQTKQKALAGPMMESTQTMLVDLYRPYTEELAAFLKDDRFAFKDRSFAR